MTDAPLPPSGKKSGIVLPSIKKPKPTDFRNDFKGQKNPKGFAGIKHSNIRRAGPRGG